MNKFVALCTLFTVLLAGCSTTEYKVFEGKDNVIDGKGGTKVVVDGMEIWDNGEPPRKFKVLGIIDDTRPGGPLPMSFLRSSMVGKAREAGGDAIIQLSSHSQVTGFYNSGTASTTAYGNSATTYGSSGTIPMKTNRAKYAVIKYVE